MYKASNTYVLFKNLADLGIKISVYEDIKRDNHPWEYIINTCTHVTVKVFDV